MNDVDVVLISGRTSQQGSGLELGKTSKEYFDSCCLVEINTSDAESMGIEDGQPVEVITDHGSIVVKGRLSKDLDKGLVFFPYGPWSNQVFGSDTDGTGMPAFKGIRATIRPIEKGKILSLEEVVDSFRREK